MHINMSVDTTHPKQQDILRSLQILTVIGVSCVPHALNGLVNTGRPSRRSMEDLASITGAGSVPGGTPCLQHNFLGVSRGNGLAKQKYFPYVRWHVHTFWRCHVRTHRLVVPGDKPYLQPFVGTHQECMIALCGWGAHSRAAEAGHTCSQQAC